jgi:hypothetical protein
VYFSFFRGKGSPKSGSPKSSGGVDSGGGGDGGGGEKLQWVGNPALQTGGRDPAAEPSENVREENDARAESPRPTPSFENASERGAARAPPSFEDVSERGAAPSFEDGDAHAASTFEDGAAERATVFRTPPPSAEAEARRGEVGAAATSPLRRSFRAPPPSAGARGLFEEADSDPPPPSIGARRTAEGAGLAEQEEGRAGAPPPAPPGAFINVNGRLLQAHANPLLVYRTRRR